MNDIQRIDTRCGVCQHPFQIKPSLAMLHGINSGHATCPKCKTFLHVEMLEGVALTEERTAYLERNNLQPSE